MSSVPEEGSRQFVCPQNWVTGVSAGQPQLDPGGRALKKPKPHLLGRTV